ILSSSPPGNRVCRATGFHWTSRIILRIDQGVLVVHRRPGFTLIELMIVVAIILVLMGLAVTGMYFVGNATREKSARTALGNARSLLAEYDVAVKTKPQPGLMWTYTPP